MTPLELARQWEQEAELLEGYGATEAGAAARRHAAQLTAVIRTNDAEELTLNEAAQESGYSKRRLRELVADGSVANAGAKGRPRIRRADLPRKARKTGANGFDAAAHAADILGGAR